jgi:hypothetical protein
MLATTDSAQLDESWGSGGVVLHEKCGDERPRDFHLGAAREIAKII